MGRIILVSIVPDGCDIFCECANGQKFTFHFPSVPDDLQLAVDRAESQILEYLSNWGVDGNENIINEWPLE